MKYATAICLGLSTALTGGCGGGGGDGPTPGPTSDGGGGIKPPDVTPTYLFYTGSLAAVDPSNPTAPAILAQQTPAWAGTLPAATYDAQTASMTNIHTRFVIYAQDGKFWKIDAALPIPLIGFPMHAAALAAPAPVQVSSETEAASVCHAHGLPDLADQNDTRLVYELPGADGDCNKTADNVWRMVSLGMDASQAPPAAKPVLTSFMNPADGSAGGWLVAEGGSLKAYDRDFGQAVDLTHGTVSMKNTVAYLNGGTLEKYLLRLDDGLYVFDARTRTLSPERHHIAGAIFAYAREGHDLAIYDAGTLYRLSLSDDAPETVVTADVQPDVVGAQIAWAGDHLVYAYTQNTAGQQLTSIKSVPAAGGAALTLADLIVSGGGFNVAGDRVYYNTLALDGTPTARSVLVDKTAALSIDKAAWTDAIAAPEVSSERGRRIDVVVLSEGYQDATLQFGGGTLSTYQAATAVRIATLGQIPGDVKFIRMGSGAGRYFLASAHSTLAQGLPDQLDVMFLDTYRDNSLVRVTNTPTATEVPLQ